jgi:predicted phage terminase large subunit-like protein
MVTRAARAMRPTALLTLTAAILSWFAALAGAGLLRADMAAAAAIENLPSEAKLLLTNPSAAQLAIAKRRAERRFIDFVELFWPVLDPEQPFVRTWVQEAIANHLEAVSAGKITKLLINVPPGFTKSRLVNVMWPAWEWGPRNRPDLRYMSWSYSAKLAEDQNADCRKIIESDLYQLFWGDRFELDETTNAKSYYKNSKGGWRRSSSVAGQTTGFRADRLLFDDPHNVADADSEAALTEATRWFARSLPTRVRNAAVDLRIRVPYWVRAAHGLGLEQDPDDDRPVTLSATIGVMQRVHLHDISGVIMKNPALGYEVLLIEMRYKGADHPARKRGLIPVSKIGYVDPRTEIGQLADPIRFPEAKVAADESQMMEGGGSDAVAAQFDQWPLELGGSWFKVEWLPVIQPNEAPADLALGVRGWDFAASDKKKSDQTANANLTRGSDKKFYLRHAAGIRGGPGDVEQFIRQQHTDDPKTLDWSIPEDPGTGKLYADYVVRELGVGRYIHTSREDKSKVTRAKPVSAQAQHGNFVIIAFPGWEKVRAELVDFPYGDHDDFVDAISRAFAKLIAQPSQEPPEGGFGSEGASGASELPQAGFDFSAGIAPEPMRLLTCRCRYGIPRHDRIEDRQRVHVERGQDSTDEAERIRRRRCVRRLLADRREEPRAHRQPEVADALERDQYGDHRHGRSLLHEPARRHRVARGTA